MTFSSDPPVKMTEPFFQKPGPRAQARQAFLQRIADRTDPAFNPQGEKHFLRLGDAYFQGGEKAFREEWQKIFHPGETSPTPEAKV